MMLRSARRLTAFVLRYPFALLALIVACLFAGAAPAHGQTFGTDFDSDYAFLSLGSPEGVPTSLGGITFLDNDTLLIGGSANNASGAIYSVDVTRDADNHITSFSGPSSLFATAPNIDGGLSFHPDSGVLFFTTFSDNMLGQIKPGSTAPDKMIDLDPFGVTSSTGSLVFVPSGFDGAGQFKIASFNGNDFYTGTLTPDGSGTFDLSNVMAHNDVVTGGPEGIVYIQGGSTGFANDSVLVSEWSADTVGAYEIDANGNPILATRRDFMSSLSGAEGAVIDPLTGDFLFSTFGGGNQVLVVSGFDVQPVLSTDPGDSETLDFGFVRIGDSASADLTVTNAGAVGSTLTGETTAASGDFSGPTPDGDFELLEGEADMQTFTFTPNTAGAQGDAIEVESNAGDHTINLSGFGVGPTAEANITPGTTIDTGLAVGPNGMTTFDLTLANTFDGDDGGDATLTTLSLLGYEITGDHADKFSLLTPLSNILAGDDLTLTIKFNPDGMFGEFDAVLTIFTDLGAPFGETGQPLSWDLTGTAEVPAPAMASMLVITFGFTLLRRQRRS